jgi:hypothetical protein
MNIIGGRAVKGTLHIVGREPIQLTGFRDVEYLLDEPVIIDPQELVYHQPGVFEMTGVCTGFRIPALKTLKRRPRGMPRAKWFSMPRGQRTLLACWSWMYPFRW